MALSIRLSDSGEDFLEVYASGFSTAVKVINWYIDNAYDGSVSSNESDWPYWTFTRLDPETTYTIKCAFFDGSGTKLDVIERDFTTDEAVEPGTIVISSRTTATADTINVVVDITGGSGTYVVQFGVTEYGATVGATHTSSRFSLPPSGGVLTLNWPFSGLKGNTRYSVRVYLMEYSSGVIEDLDSDTIWTDAPPRPANWTWESDVRKGAAVPTSKVSGTENDYAAAFLTRAEWFRFLDRIQEFALYCDVALDAGTLNNAKVSVVVVGYPMTAVQLNAARSLIRSLDYTTAPPAAIVRGGVVTAAFVNGLATALNSIP